MVTSHQITYSLTPKTLTQQPTPTPTGTPSSQSTRVSTAPISHPPIIGGSYGEAGGTVGDGKCDFPIFSILIPFCNLSVCDVVSCQFLDTLAIKDKSGVLNERTSLLILELQFCS